MADICTIREAVKRAKADQIPVSEYALRQMIHAGQFKVRYVGKKKALIYYPSLVQFLKCAPSDSNELDNVRKVG